ncbi:hypothetical protein NXW97_24395 [Bacteroides faecis]|uniref:Uncharacterized protein n=1 Tax=Bacteroides faecis TaxID=674529 RepID=A0AAW5P3I7_9BACE|nr:hypothetical protein [Bacteroides faecis]MCS2795090.1 hypothetical protein [Bacteroides faecis]
MLCLSRAGIASWRCNPAINEDRVDDDHNQRAQARSSEDDCWTLSLTNMKKQPKCYRKNGQDRRQDTYKRGETA